MLRIVQLDVVLFAAGVALGSLLVATPTIGWVGFFAALLLRLAYQRRAATLALGLFASSLSVADAPEAVFDEPADFVVRGRVLDGPRTLGGGYGYELSVDTLDDKPTDVDVRLFSRGAAATAGDFVETFARCSAYSPAEVPGDRGARARWAARDIAGRCSALEPLQVVKLNDSLGSRLRRGLAARRLAVESRIRGVLGRRAGVAIAMLTGSRGELTYSERRAHERGGTAHLLAISGLHFGALAAIVWGLAGFVLRRIPRVTRTVGARRASAVFVLVVMLAYLLLVGAPISATRAYIALATAACALILGRRASGPAAVALAASALLLSSRGLLWDLGFQLSFAATSAIVLFWLRLPPWLAHDRYAFEQISRAKRWSRNTATFVLMSWCATLATAPILVGATGEISTISLLTNLFAVPIVSAIIFPALVGGVLFDGPLTRLGDALLWFGTESMLRLTLVIEDATTLPFAVLTPGSPPRWWTVAAVGITLTVIATRIDIRAIAASVVTLAVAGQFAWPTHEVARVHFIPVGQGDATLIEDPRGRVVLIDAGGSAFGADPGRRFVVPYLRRIGCTRLDAIVITHADTDHAGGVPAVLEEVEVDHLVTEPGQFEALGFPGFSAARWAEAGSRNDRSIVITHEFGGVITLLTGDVEEAAETNWLGGEPHRVQILKVAHHGSKTSSTDAFLDAARPLLAVVSAGRHNRFGHPAPDVIDRFDDRAIRTLSTAKHGLVRVEISTQGRIHALVRRP